MESRAARVLIKAGAVLVLLFLYMPLAVVVIYAFNDSVGQAWPIDDFTGKWFGIAWRSADVRTALANSLSVVTMVTLIALVLGSAAAFAVHRFRFFGRNAVSFLLILPIALPGIVTAIALNSAINTFAIPFGIQTIVIAHATFCIVVVYNNVIARFRRLSPSLVEASADLGASGLQTFRHILLPNLATALLAGGLLSFALSFDEIIVTTFTAGQLQTLPIFIFRSLFRPRSQPVTNVVAMMMVAITFVPILLAQRLTRETVSEAHR